MMRAPWLRGEGKTPNELSVSSDESSRSHAGIKKHSSVCSISSGRAGGGWGQAGLAPPAGQDCENMSRDLPFSTGSVECKFYKTEAEFWTGGNNELSKDWLNWHFQIQGKDQPTFSPISFFPTCPLVPLPFIPAEEAFVQSDRLQHEDHVLGSIFSCGLTGSWMGIKTNQSIRFIVMEGHVTQCNKGDGGLGWKCS